MYAGTKHSTVTALGKIMSPEQIKHNVTGHTSSAFQRYFLPDHNEKISATRKVAEMQGDRHKKQLKKIQIPWLKLIVITLNFSFYLTGGQTFLLGNQFRLETPSLHRGNMQVVA